MAEINKKIIKLQANWRKYIQKKQYLTKKSKRKILMRFVF